MFRLQVVLPLRYPIGKVRGRVRLLTEPDHLDTNEEGRLNLLRADEWDQNGLVRTGSTIALSVPKPEPDRLYEIQWTLPTRAQRRKWETGTRRPPARQHSAKFRKKTGPRDALRFLAP
jgi:hypothetical protein